MVGVLMQEMGVLAFVRQVRNVVIYFAVVTVAEVVARAPSDVFDDNSHTFR